MDFQKMSSEEIKNYYIIEYEKKREKDFNSPDVIVLSREQYEEFLRWQSRNSREVVEDSQVPSPHV